MRLKLSLLLGCANRRAGLRPAGKARNDTPGSVEGDVGAAYGGRNTGISLPFDGQPVQVLSGFAMNRAAGGSWYVLSDNVLCREGLAA